MSSGRTTGAYGLVAEFRSADDLLNAADHVREAGYTKTDAFSPIPVHGLAEALGAKASKLPLLVFGGGATGAMAGFGLEYWVSVIRYPHIVSGKPFFSWPSFFSVIFELTILFAAGAAVVGMIVLNGLPRPYHPVFSAPNFDKSSTDGYFLAIEAVDPVYETEKTEGFLRGLGAIAVTEVMNHPDDEEAA